MDAEDTSLAARVAFLCRPDTYPGPPARVEAIETRLSWVFLTPTHAWKLKKPLRYDHIDFSFPGARHADCEAEVRLNAALAPGVYLGVVTLTRSGDGRLALGGEGTPIDWLVQMRRLPGAQCLEAQARLGRVDPDGVARAAVALARFYADARRFQPATVDELDKTILDTAAELRCLPPPVASGNDRLTRALVHWLRDHAELVTARARVDAHGDLRPQHVYLGEQALIIDRLTYSRSLRILDPVEELAFLDLECARLGVAWVGPRFRAAYTEATGDRPAPLLEAFYRARRAQLWALLSGRHLLRGGSDRPWRTLSLTYLELGNAALSR